MASLFQFSIRGLLIAVTIAAVGIAALLNANVWWEEAAWLIALSLLTGGILLCIYRRDGQRAFWLGFVIVGGLYLGLLLFTALIDRYYELASSRLSQLAYGIIIPDARQSEYLPSSGAGSATNAIAYSYTVIASPPTPTGSPYASDPYAEQMALATAGPYTAPVRGPVSFPLASATAWTPNPDHIPLARFISVAHSLWLLLAAAIGGKVCQWIHRTRAPECTNPTQ